MSDPLRIALVAEGATEREVIDAALKVILAPRSFVLTQLQPEATKPDIGGGWGGVLKWCHQLAARSQPGGGAVEADPTLSIFARPSRTPRLQRVDGWPCHAQPLARQHRSHKMPCSRHFCLG